MIIDRWRRRGHRSSDVFPSHEEFLELMLEDDTLSRNKTFTIEKPGEDIKRTGVREPIIVTWNGKLLDGNRRKFAIMWALSDRAGADIGQRQLLEQAPMFVLPSDAPDSQEKFILIQENYAESLKEPWPEVVTNGELYDKYQELSLQLPNEDDLSIRRRLHDEFPRFPVTDIRNRIETWQLTLEFRGEYSDELDEDELDRLINDRFQYFRQAVDTFRRRDVFTEPEFRDLLFKGIHHGLFPSFASVRTLEEIHNSPQATEIFNQGEGMSDAQKRDNFRDARDEARRERAERERSVENRLESLMEFLDNLTSAELASLSSDAVVRLQDVLERVVAQVEASSHGVPVTSEK